MKQQKEKITLQQTFILLACLLVDLLALSSSANAGQAKYIYDDVGRLSQVIDDQGNVATYSYDAVGNILSITRSTGGINPPLITGVSPNTANAGTAIPLVLTGSNLSGSALKTDNPGIAVSNVSTSSNSLTATLTISFAARTGATTLTVSHAGGSASTTINIGAAAPIISQLSPNSGPISRLVTITGNGFSSTPGLNTIKFNGTVATVFSASPTKMVTAVPQGATTGSVTVTVTVGGLVSAGVPFTVTSSGPPPGINSITPAVGSVEGGGAVTVTGSGFAQNTLMYIGGNQALKMTIQDSSTFTAFTPPGNLGAADVQVTNANGDALLQGGFTYLSGPPERIVAINPTMGVTTSPQNATISVLFSRPVDRATIIPATYSLVQNSTNSAVSGTFFYTLGDQQVIFKPTTPLAAGTTYTLKLTQGVKSVEGIPLESSFIGAFTTTVGSDTISPTVSVSPANGAANAPYNTSIVFTFSEPIDPTTLTSARLTVTNQGNVKTGTLQISQGNTVATFIPSSPFVPNTAVGLVLSGQVTDAAGNLLVGSSGVGSNFVSNFTTATTADRVPPILLGITPPNGATGINTNAAITLTFNESLDPATITPSTLSVTSGGLIRPGHLLLTNFNSVVTYIPDQPYPAFSQVTLTVAPGLADVSGNSILSITTSTFTTQSSLDNFQPSVINVSPAGDNVPLNSRVTIVFSERVNPITVTSTTFALYTDRFAGQVSGTVSVAPDQLSATLTPDQPLLPNTNYYITYTTGIKDLAGNPLFNPQPAFGGIFGTAKVFRTGVQLSDRQGATVLEISPSNGTGGVPTNAQVLLRFSEPIAPPTATPQNIVIAAGGVPVDTEISLEQNNTVARIKVANLLTLQSNRFYDVTVTTGVHDMADNPLTASFISGFTTGAATDTTPPTATMTPANGTTVSPTTAISLTFNEKISPISISSSSFYISGGSIGVPPSGTITVSSDRTGVTFQPQGPLPAGQSLFVSVFGIEDLAGNKMPSFTNSFTTSLAAGTDSNALPFSATVTVNPTQLFADGQSLGTVTITNITDRFGTLVPNGTKIAVTAVQAFNASAGGSILEGTTSAADARFKIVTTFGGRATITYQAANRPELLPGQTANAALQVGSVDSAENPVGLIGQGTATLYRYSGALISSNPFLLLANGTSYAQIDVTVNGTNGNAVPEGKRVGITTDPVFYTTSIAGTLSGGSPAADPRFRIFTTDREGKFTLTYIAPTLGPTETGTAFVQAAEVDDLGNVLSYLGSQTISLSGSAGAVAPQPKIVSVSPAQGSMGMGTNVPVVIGFSESLDFSTVTASSVQLIGPGSVPMPGVLTAGDGGGGVNSVVTLTPSGPLLPNTTYTVFVDSTIKSATGNSLLTSSSTTFSTANGADSQAPSVLLVNPMNGASGVGTNVVVMVKFSEEINAATLHSGSVSLSGSGGAIPANLTAAFDPQVGQTLLTLTPQQFLASNTLYTFTLSASITDTAGNPLAAPISTTFTTQAVADSIQPSVTVVTPSGTNVPLNAKVTIVFSKPINPITVTSQNFYLSNASGRIAVAPDLLSATLTPDHPLAPSTTYAINFLAGISDVSGNPIYNPTGPFRFGSNPAYFTTGSQFSDTTGPTLVSISPVDGATGVPVNAQVLLQFSEPLSPASITSQTIQAASGGIPVNTEVSLDPYNNALVRLKVANLLTWAAGTLYDITVTTGVRDVADNPLSASVVSHFTTGSISDTTRPTVVSVNPPNNGTIGPSGPITITFSEPIALPSVSSNAIYISGGGVNAQLPGTVTASSDRMMLTFTPTPPLFVGGFYFLSVNNIEDLAHNLVGGISSNFSVPVAAGTDPNSLPTSAVATTSGSLLADGQSTTTVTFTGISRNGVLVPDGTKVAVTAAPAYQVLSAGGAILGGVTSAADPRFQIFTVTGGQVTVTYQSPSLPNLSGNSSQAFAYIQVAAVDAAESPASLIGTGLVGLFRGTQVISQQINPNTLLADGASYASVTLTLQDANGNPFPPGVLIGATADPVYNPSAGGVLSGGIPAPDPRFRLYSTTRGGSVEITYTAPSLAAGQTGIGSIQFVEVDGQGNAVRQLTTLNISLSGSSGYTAPQPVITAVSPAQGQSSVAVNSPIVVAFSESVDPSTVTPSSFLVLGPNSVAVSGTPAFSAGPAGPNSIVTFTPNAPLAVNSSFTLFVSSSIQSASGIPIFASQAVTFSTGTATDVTAPTVTAYTPPSGYTGVPTNAVVMIEFSELMNAATINFATLTLTAGSTSVAARLSVLHDFSRGRSTALLTPEQFLPGNTTFTVSLTGGSDTAGNALAFPLSFHFTTTGQSTTIAPTVVGFSPAPGTIGVPLNAKASIIFSEPINPLSVYNGSFYIGWDYGQVSATIVVAPDLLSATLVPDLPLLANTRYYIVYTNKITDLAGNALANPIAPATNTFTTGAVAADTTPPTLVAVTPANGASAVPTNAIVALQFSEPLSAASVNPSTVTLSAGGTAIAGTVTLLHGVYIQFRPSVASLQAGATYTVSVSTGVTDLAGNPLAGAVLSTFTVGSQADTTQPTVLSMSPADTTSNVPTTSSIVVTFSEPINPASINSSNDAVRLTGGGLNGPTPGSISFSPDNRAVTFTPTFPLFAGQFYFFQLTNVVQDQVGLALSGSLTTTFATGYAVGTDVASLPNSGIVTSNPNTLLADGLTTATVSITGVSRNGILVPDGTKVAITAAPAYIASSAGGAILGGVTSAADPRFQIFTVTGGQVTVTYRSPSLPNLSGNSSQAFAYIQVAAADAGDAPGSLIGAGGVTLFRGTQVINQQINPNTLLADGASYASVTLTLQDANGNPFPPGVLIGATADPVYIPTAAGGVLSGGIPAPDPRFRLYSTIRGGTVEITYTVPSLASGQTGIGYIQVVEVDGQGNAVRLLATLSVALSGSSGFTAPQPVVTAISPAYGETHVAINSPVVVAFSQSLDPATVTPDTLYLAGPDSIRVSGTRTLSNGSGGPNSVVTFTPDVPLAPNRSFYTVVINSSITNTTGVPLLSSQAASFSMGTGFDTTPPTVTLANPADGASGVPTNVLIMVEFSERMNAASLNPGTISLSSSSGPIAGRVQVSTDPQNITTIASFVPDQFLPGNQSYTLTAFGMTDTAGNPLASPFSLTFSTQSASDSTQPSVAGFNPASGSIDVPATIAVSVTFSEPINPVSITPSTLFISGPTVVKSRYDFSNGNATVTLTPTAPLAADGQYSIVASRGILDVAGNNLFTPASSSFRIALSPGTANLPTAATVTINPQQFFSNGQIATTVTISNINRNGTPVPNGTIIAVTADPVFTSSIGGVISGNSLGTSADPRFLLFSTFGAAVTFSYTPPDVTYLPLRGSENGAIQVASVDLDNRPVSIIAYSFTTLTGVWDATSVGSPTLLTANGTSTSAISVTLKDSQGNLLPDGTRIGLTVANIFVSNSAGGTLIGGATSVADPRVQIFTTSAGQITATFQSPTDRATGSATVQIVTVDANGNPTGLAGSIPITLQ